MTLTVTNDLLTHFVFSVIGKRKNQSPTQAFMNLYMPSEAQRKKVSRAISEESQSKILLVMSEILTSRTVEPYSHSVLCDECDYDSSHELFQEELEDYLTQQQKLLNTLESDTTHYYLSFGTSFTKSVLAGFKLGFPYDEKSAPMYLLIDYLDSIVGYVSESSEDTDYGFSGIKYTDNILNYVVVLAEFLHFSNGGTFDDEVDTSFISKWEPEISKGGSLVPTRYKVIKELYNTLAPSFRDEQASVSSNPEYQQKKTNLGPKELDSDNAANNVEKISPTSLKRHLGINASSEYDETHGTLRLIISLLEIADQFQRHAIAEGYSVIKIVDEFSGLPDMQQEFRDHLVAFSRQLEFKNYHATFLRQRD